MRQYRWEVKGPVRGYVHGMVKLDRAKAKRKREYDAWKSLVRFTANTAGVPSEIASSESWAVCVVAEWTGRARIDGDGVLKGVLDALWKRDRRVLIGEYRSVECVEGEELVRIIVWEIA